MDPFVVARFINLPMHFFVTFKQMDCMGVWTSQNVVSTVGGLGAKYRMHVQRGMQHCLVTWDPHFRFRIRSQVWRESASRIRWRRLHKRAEKQIIHQLHWEASSLSHWRNTLLLHNLSIAPILFCKEGGIKSVNSIWQDINDFSSLSGRKELRVGSMVP